MFSFNVNASHRIECLASVETNGSLNFLSLERNESN